MWWLCAWLEMSCSLEKVLTDARSLVERLRDHDNAAEILIEQTTVLNKRVEAMKQVHTHTQIPSPACVFLLCILIKHVYETSDVQIMATITTTADSLKSFSEYLVLLCGSDHHHKNTHPL